MAATITPDFAYTVTIPAHDMVTLEWLEDHGYSGDFLLLGHRLDPGCQGCDGEGCEACEAGPQTFGFSEPEAWEWQENVNADPDAFLACNGSRTLADVLWGFFEAIV